MNRRGALRIANATGLSIRTLTLRAQTSAASLRRVAVLAPSTRAREALILEPFYDVMRRLGWIEGRSIAYDAVYADDLHQELPRLAVELVARQPELIFTPSQVTALAARQATRTIPIVFGTGIDPVGAGLVVSLARPGGNVTGVQPTRFELVINLKAARILGLTIPPSLLLRANEVIQ